MSRWFALGLLLCVACGGTTNEQNTPELNLGVSMDAEARAIVAALERVGYVVDARIDATRFIAIGMHRGQTQTLVRVVTSRGVAFSVEGDTAGLPATPPIRLVVPEVGEERLRASSDVVVATPDAALERTCLRILSVRDDDSVRDVPLRLAGLPRDACIEELRDVDEDSTLEAIVVWRAYSLARSDTPSLRVPLARDAGTGGLSSSRVAFAQYFDRLARQCDAVIEDARQHANVERAYTRAVELAMLVLFRTQSVETALRSLTTTLSGFVLSESVARSVQDARDAISRGMTEPATSDRQPSDVESGRP